MSAEGGVNTAMLSSMQNAGSSALNASAKLKLMHFLAELDYHNKLDLSTLALPWAKQVMPGAGMTALLPCMNNQSLIAKILADIMGRNISRDEFAAMVAELQDHASDVTAALASASVDDHDMGHFKHNAAMNVQENAAAAVMDV